MRRARLRVAAALIVPCLALVAGCNLLGGDDAPPPDNAAVNQSDEDIAEGVGGTALEMLGAMIDASSGVIEPSPFRSESVAWSSQAGLWTFTGDDAYDDPDASGSVTYTMTVQFLDDGAPQQYVDDFTDRIEITSAIRNVGNHHPQDRGFDADYDFDATGALHAELQGSIVVASGSGSLSGSTRAHFGRATVTRPQNASWTYTLSVDTSVPDDCPAGTFGGTTNDFTFDGAFDDGAAAWTVRRNGAVVRQLTGTVSCGGGGGAQGG